MDNEVTPIVYDYLQKQYRNGKVKTATEILGGLGVKLHGSENSNYAWKRKGLKPEIIATIWSENIRVDPNGRWYAPEVFDLSRKPAPLVPIQADRDQERYALLNEAATKKAPFIAILQINEKSRAELVLNRTGSAKLRTKDDHHWHVVVSDRAKGQAWLVRGDPAGWVPPADDAEGSSQPSELNDTDSVQAEPSPGEVAPPSPPAAGPANNEPDFSDPKKDGRGGYADAATRKRVEEAAVRFATAHFEKTEQQRYRVVSVEEENLGYDLQILDRESGELVWMVEVKGTSGAELGYFLTRNESNTAKKEPEQWRLAIVTSALEKPTITVFTAEEMNERFSFEPIAWRCRPLA
ncbi:DUF3883 domain-containing protein [Crenobacter sp. SG2305]|uniref:DUF3883 domain-containing protein n=1 Tax=Crenobacter oryzisoli TaxID=3056844 RepID=UPI0025AAA4C1|nr:DUF3883 domain-containing protein [Crenobacter sp. SG2305]MDN0082365.1 DUF3883 domain-containing protein [Crenobacter sp. SG2305]